MLKGAPRAALPPLPTMLELPKAPWWRRVGRARGVATTRLGDPTTGISPVQDRHAVELAFRDGEIVVRGSLVMSGYEQPEANAECWTAEGWLRSGDLGYLDGNGWLTVKCLDDGSEAKRRGKRRRLPW